MKADPVLVWVHGDSLSPADPAARAHPGAPRVFVFDAPWLRQVRPSFKRLFFLWECAEEAADEIRLGDPVEELKAACRARDIGTLAVTRSRAPRYGEMVLRLKQELTVAEYAPEDLVSVPDDYVVQRFGTFWRKFGRAWQ